MEPEEQFIEAVRILIDEPAIDDFEWLRDAVLFRLAEYDEAKNRVRFANAVVRQVRGAE